jgi:hypothetical protein
MAAQRDKIPGKRVFLPWRSNFSFEMTIDHAVAESPAIECNLMPAMGLLTVVTPSIFGTSSPHCSGETRDAHGQSCVNAKKVYR